MAGSVGWLDPHVERYLLLSEQEYIVLEVRKHWMASIGAWLRLVVGVPVLVSSFAFQPPVFWVLFVLAAGVVAQALYAIADQYRDRFVITNQRVFRVHGLLNRKEATMPLSRILDITVDKPIQGRILSFGHFTFESAAQEQGLRDIKYVGRPDERNLTIQRVVTRAGLRGRSPQQVPKESEVSSDSGR